LTHYFIENVYVYMYLIFFGYDILIRKFRV